MAAPTEGRTDERRVGKEGRRRGAVEARVRGDAVEGTTNIEAYAWSITFSAPGMARIVVSALEPQSVSPRSRP